MGILSRKMAMPAQIAANPIHYKEVLTHKKIDPKKLQPKIDLFNPVLGGKSYVGGGKATGSVRKASEAAAIVYSTNP